MRGMNREDLIALAREAVAAKRRTLMGGTETQLPAVRDPATFEPPEWVLEAMRLAYSLGHEDGSRSGAELYPEGG